MDAATFTAATASLDQWSGAVAWAETLWPENCDMLNNARIEKVVLRALAETAEDRNGEDAHLLIPSTDLVLSLTPGADVGRAIQALAADWAVCDYHSGDSGPVVGLLPLVTPPQVVTLALCPRCCGVLDAAYPQATFVLLDAIPDSPEGTTR